MMEIRSFNAHRRCRIRHAEIIRLVLLVLRGERRRRAAVNIVFVNERKMVDLNGRYLRRSSTTDVLSFPLEDKDGDLLEGEVYVNLDQARRQARDYRVTFAQEKARLVVHGVLHLVGYSDSNPRNRARMTRTEEKYLSRFAK